MVISTKDSIEIILLTFPEFVKNWNQHLDFCRIDEERPYGLDIAEFSSFACGIITNGCNKEIHKLIDLTEKMLTEGNDKVKETFKFEFLENITNRSNIPIERFTKQLKQNSSDVCVDIDNLWGTKTPGLDDWDH